MVIVLAQSINQVAFYSKLRFSIRPMRGPDVMGTSSSGQPAKREVLGKCIFNGKSFSTLAGMRQIKLNI